MTNPTIIPTPAGHEGKTYELLATLTAEQATTPELAGLVKRTNVYFIHTYGKTRHAWNLVWGDTPTAAITNMYGTIGQSIRWNAKKDTTPMPAPTLEDLFAHNGF